MSKEPAWLRRRLAVVLFGAIATSAAPGWADPIDAPLSPPLSHVLGNTRTRLLAGTSFDFPRLSGGEEDGKRAFVVDTTISLRHTGRLLPLLLVVQVPFARAELHPTQSAPDLRDDDVALGNLSLGAFWIRETQRWPWLERIPEWLKLPGYLEWQSDLGITVMPPTGTGDEHPLPRRALRRARIMERGAYLTDTWLLRPSYDWRLDVMAGLHLFLQAHTALEMFVNDGALGLSGRVAVSIGAGNSWLGGAIEYMHHNDLGWLTGGNELDEEIEGNQHILASTFHIRLRGFSLRLRGYLRPHLDDVGVGVELGKPL